MSGDVWGRTISLSGPRTCCCICFQSLQRANLYRRKSPGFFLSGLSELVWEITYRTIRTGTFKQAKRSQLRRCPICPGQRRGDKFIRFQPPSLAITLLPPRHQIKTRHPDINCTKRSKTFEMSRPEIPLLGESCSPSICPSNKLSFLVCATEYNWPGKPFTKVYFSSCNTSSYISCTTLRHMQNINKSRQKSSRVLLLDVSNTPGSNLLLQVAPYKPGVPSQVSQIKKTKALKLELLCFLSFFGLLRQYKIQKVKLLEWWNNTKWKLHLCFLTSVWCQGFHGVSKFAQVD